MFKIILIITLVGNLLASVNKKKLENLLKEIQNLENHKGKKEKKQRKLFMPYYYNPMMMNPNITTHISTEKSTVPPYKTIHTQAHHQNMLAMDPHMSNPYFSPFYHGISPFMGFNHFNPFMMPGGPQGMNPLYSGYLGMEYMSKLPQMKAYSQGFQYSNIPGNDADEDTRKLTLDVKNNLGVPGDYNQVLQDKINLQEALSQEELNQQLATLNGVSKQEYKDFKQLENEAEESDHIHEKKENKKEKEENRI